MSSWRAGIITTTTTTIIITIITTVESLWCRPIPGGGTATVITIIITTITIIITISTASSDRRGWRDDYEFARAFDRDGSAPGFLWRAR